jgi:hypothetical protein
MSLDFWNDDSQAPNKYNPIENFEFYNLVFEKLFVHFVTVYSHSADVVDCGLLGLSHVEFANEIVNRILVLVVAMKMRRLKTIFTS